MKMIIILKNGDTHVYTQFGYNLDVRQLLDMFGFIFIGETKIDADEIEEII